jgi:mannose-6-phosphate isomerase-like protein (cupin superfamily)
MLVHRWQAEKLPSKEQIITMFEGEGLEPKEEYYISQTRITDHRHPFNEVRVVFSGEMQLNISGTQLLLRAGDRIEIPANTKHSFKTNQSDCLCITAQRLF